MSWSTCLDGFPTYPRAPPAPLAAAAAAAAAADVDAAAGVELADWARPPPPVSKARPPPPVSKGSVALLQPHVRAS